jgi:tryptophan-rich sensory protein
MNKSTDKPTDKTTNKSSPKTTNKNLTKTPTKSCCKVDLCKKPFDHCQKVKPFDPCQKIKPFDFSLHEKSDCASQFNPCEKLSYWSTFTRLDFILIYSLTILAYVLFFTSYLSGIYSEWYASIIPDGVNVWIPRVLWVIATIISYIGLYILWKDATDYTIPFYLSISVLFLIGTILTVSWSIATYQGQSLSLGAWFSAILFLYQFWLATYIWHINIVASILLIPLVLMYGYLFYSIVHLASINNVIV